jgi:hypothetical protein
MVWLTSEPEQARLLAGEDEIGFAPMRPSGTFATCS